jgi:hypothetical protein
MTPDAQRARAHLKIWWIVWAAVLITLVAVYLGAWFFKLQGGGATKNPFANLVGFVPLFVSIVIRWLVLPRSNSLSGAFPMFVVGLALAESCGVLGIFWGGPYRDALFFLGVLGIVQYAPGFAKALIEPKPQGYIPNN